MWVYVYPTMMFLNNLHTAVLKDNPSLIERLNRNLDITLTLNPWPYYAVASMWAKTQKQDWKELSRCCFIIHETPLKNSTQHDFHICDRSLRVTFNPNSRRSSRKNDDTIFQIPNYKRSSPKQNQLHSEVLAMTMPNPVKFSARNPTSPC